jgi:hypothetical protein
LLSGVTVTFTAPNTGASGAFAGSLTATATTNGSGIATAPTFTANGQTGAYTITARVVGVATAANFSLTNLAGVPASVTATGGTPQGATVNTVFATALQATVKDAGNNLLSGVTVTFTAPNTGASAAFGGSLTTTATTNASGVATAPAFTANGQTGSYSVTASVTGVAATANFSLTNTAVVSGGTGSLSGSGNSLTTAANLTTEGTTDWVHWGDASLTRKTGVPAQIGLYSVVGSGPVQSYTNDPRALSWTDGTPTASGSNNNGLYVNFSGNGFSFTVPADTNARKLIVHVGGWASGGTLTAHLSDTSAPDYTDTTAQASGQYDRNYTLTYSAASAGQTLTIKWVNSSNAGNVTINGVALTLAGPSVAATGGTPQSATVNTGFGSSLQATVKDAGNNPLGGVTVTFTAPSSGPSASFSGSSTTTASTDVNGIASAAAPTANGQAGAYSITASAPGAAATASFNLTNLASPPGPPASVTASAGTPQTVTVNSSLGTGLQATVKDASNNLLSGVIVTFTAPNSGASGLFGASLTATATTNGSGEQPDRRLRCNRHRSGSGDRG